MTRWTLLGAVAAAPIAAFAAASAGIGQVVEVDTYDVAASVSYLNAGHCAGAAPVHLEWALARAVLRTDSVYRIFASDTAPPDAGDPLVAGFCPEVDAFGGPGGNVFAGQLGAIVASSPVQDGSFSADALAAEANATCTAASEGKVLHVCSHLYDGATRTGAAHGKLVIQVAAPAPPAAVEVAAGAEALHVTWTPGAGAAPAHRSVVLATPVPEGSDAPLPGAPTTASAATDGTALRVAGLTAGQRYRVAVVAYSVGGNPSAESTPAFGTPAAVVPEPPVPEPVPEPVGGSGGGGCGTGPSGAAALLAMAFLLGMLRRNP